MPPRPLTDDQVICIYDAVSAFHGTVAGHVAQVLGLEADMARTDYAKRFLPLFREFKTDPTREGATKLLTAVATDALALLENLK